MVNILYEDNHIIVVLKPQNIPSQADESKDLDILTMVKNYIKEKYNKPNNVYCGLVHRLDRPTGGIMVFAKTSKAASRLSQQIRDGSFEKKYFAVVLNNVRDKTARLENYLKKDNSENIVKVVPIGETGAKKAELLYRVLDTKKDDTKVLNLIEVKLFTGRSHQIRVQMSNIGNPICGDMKYGGDKYGKINLALYAVELKFIHPTTKQTMIFKVCPPDELPWKFFDCEKYLKL